MDLVRRQNTLIERQNALMASQSQELGAIVMHTFYARKKLEQFATIGVGVKNAPGEELVVT